MPEATTNSAGVAEGSCISLPCEKPAHAIIEHMQAIIDQRDAAVFLANEIIGTLLIDRNRDYVPTELRDLAQNRWLPMLRRDVTRHDPLAQARS